MPTLLEFQRAMARSTGHNDRAAIAPLLDPHVGEDRLDIYRNTAISGLTNALRICYPVVNRLVGGDFFDAASQVFIEGHLPSAAYLNLYGNEFAAFLASFGPASSLPYLPDVARLEWAVNCALHAFDEPPFDFAKLSEIADCDQAGVRFIFHPSISLLRLAFPVDAIWRAIVDKDDQALAAIDASPAQVHLMIARRKTGVVVERLEPTAWHFANALSSGQSLQSAITMSPTFESMPVLADLLAQECFSAFSLIDPPQNLALGIPQDGDNV